jgi:4-diphosphocytidyl-2-C-methyl-D-erythritol kinase
MLCFPNAKINIGLQVTGKLPNGYHTIESLFYPVPLKDVLEIHLNSSKTLILHDLSPKKASVHPQDNIIFKAWTLLHQEFNIPGVDVDLYKAIPMGAGLGGGSADAAFFIKACHDLFELGLSEERMMDLAGTLGSDCSFFIKNEVSFVGGTGDQISPFVLDLNHYYLGLINPGIHISTAEAYAGIIPEPPKTDLKAFLSQNSPKDWKEVVKNDFEAHIFLKHPQLAKIKSDLYHMGAIYASMSGSGSTMYGIFDKNPALELKNTFLGMFVWSHKLCTHGF